MPARVREPHAAISQATSALCASPSGIVGVLRLPGGLAKIEPSLFLQGWRDEEVGTIFFLNFRFSASDLDVVQLI
jgi:hypothetical protein